MRRTFSKNKAYFGEDRMRTIAQQLGCFPSNFGSGLPYHLVLEITRNLTANEEQEFTFTVPIDCVCFGAHAVAFINDGGNAAQTDNFAWNLQDSYSQQYLIETRGDLLGIGDAAPMNLISGQTGGPMAWPSPKVFYQGSTIRLKVNPGADIVYLKISLVGERFDRIRDKQKIVELCGDPRTTGYVGILFDSLTLSAPFGVAVPGEQSRTVMNVGSQSYDYMITSISAMLVDSSLPNVPLSTAVAPYCELAFRETNTNSETSLSLVPLSFYCGQTFPSSADDQSRLYRPTQTTLPLMWRIPQQTSVELVARAISIPAGLGGEMQLRIVMQGFKVPGEVEAIGFPYFNRATGSINCAPESMRSDGVYTIPGSPIPWPNSQMSPVVSGPQARNPNGPGIPQGVTPMVNPATGRPFYPGYANDPRYGGLPPGCPPGYSRG